LTADLDLPNIPTALAERFGVNVFVAGLIVSAVLIIFTVMLIGFVMRRGKGLTYGVIGCELVVVAVTVALGWMPVYVMILLILVIAVLYAGVITKTLGGG